MSRRDTGVAMSVRHAKRSANQKRITEDEDPDMAAGGGGGGGGDFDDDEGAGGSRPKKGAKKTSKKRASVVATPGNPDDDGDSAFERGGGGGGGVDADKEKKEPAGPMGFTEFDPNRMGLRKNKNAPRAGSFSSKSKFKRRK